VQLMDFALTDDEKAFRAKVRDFAENEVRPIVPKLEGTEEFPWETVKKMAAMGLFGLIFPKKYGGVELGYIYYVLGVLRNLVREVMLVVHKPPRCLMVMSG